MFWIARIAGRSSVQGKIIQDVIIEIHKDTTSFFIVFFWLALKIRKEEIRITAIKIKPERKYSLWIGKVQNLNFSKVSAILVIKFANVVDILKIKIAISWVIFWGIKETAVAITPEIKLQKAGLTQSIFVKGETVLNT